jgi:hypothetical protein
VYRSLLSDLLGLEPVWEPVLAFMVPDGDLHPVSLTPRWVWLKPCGSVAARAVGSAIATTLVGTVLVAFSPLAKSTSYLSFD